MTKSEILITLKNLENKSNCDKRGVGAVLVDSLGYIVCTGYNHIAFDSMKEECHRCTHNGTPILCPAIHAEIDCLTRTSDVEIKTRQATTMYVSYSPCPDCCKAIREAGVKTVVVKEPRTSHIWLDEYMTYDQLSEKLLSGINYIRLWELPNDTTSKIGETL